MTVFIRVLGLLYICLGIFGLIATKKFTLTLSNFIKNTRRQTLGLVSLIIGVLLLLAASSARESWFVLALGIIACLKGATTVLMSEHKIKAIIDWWLAAPDIVYKAWATFALILGVALFYVI